MVAKARLSFRLCLGGLLDFAQVFFQEKDAADYTAQNPNCHYKRNGCKGRHAHFRKLQAGQADALRCYFSHVKLILERSDNGQTQPGKGHSQRSAQGNDTQQYADTGQNRKGGAGDNGSLQHFFIHSDRQARTVALYQINKTHYRNKKKDAGNQQVKESGIYTCYIFVVHKYVLLVGSRLRYRRCSFFREKGRRYGTPHSHQIMMLILQV